MRVICPAILAENTQQYHDQMAKIASFAERIQIDLTDAEFASHRTVSPQEAWWPVGVQADFHLMYKIPDNAINSILEHKPHMIIVHAEAEGNFLAYAERFRSLDVKLGLALLPRTPVQTIAPGLNYLDHVLLFSGNLGEYGGHANLDLLNKAQEIKQHRSDIEVGWDGGVNTHNISQLAFGGIDVFNVGGFLQESADPERDYNALKRIAEETGTT